MTESNITVITTFSCYFLFVFYIGWIAYRRTNTISDYILGGRRLGRWTTALSAGASDMSGWLLLGLPGYAYAAGLESIWLAMGLLIGTYINWLLIAPRLREQSESIGNALTLPEFFEYRFQDKTHGLRLTTAFFTLLFFLFYTCSGLVAGGKLFESVFGLPYHWAVMSGAAAILIYTSIGGFLAVSWTDLLQGLLMIMALAIAAVFSLQELGGYQSAIDAMLNTNPNFLNPFTDNAGNGISMITLLSLLGWGLGYFGQPHILVRFMAIQSSTMIADARRIAISWTIISMAAAIIIGLTGIIYLTEALAGSDTEKVFIMMVSAVFHPAVAGICLAAILAAIMSTADSQLLVASSAVTEDFYKALLKQQASERELILTGRVSVITVAIIATVIALNPEQRVLELVSYAWAGFGAAFGPTLLLSLLWKDMTKAGAFAGIITGALTVIIWKQLEGGLFELYELVPGFFFSLIAIIIVSKMQKIK